MKGLLHGLLICAAALAFASAARADTVALSFYRYGSAFTERRTIQGPATPLVAVQLLLEGPTAEDAASGVVSAIPAGTQLLGFQPTQNGAIIELSSEAVTGLDEITCEMIFKQFVYTLMPFGLDVNVRVNVGGKPLSSYLAPCPPAIYSAPITRPAAAPSTVGLSGRRITVSPGHGYYWWNAGGVWTTQRGVVCGYPPEDFHDLDIAQFLRKYLEQDGAYVQWVREFDKTRGNGPSGHPWWQESAYVYLKDAGYSCSVYASSSGVCSYTGAEHANDDVRCRGLASNLDSRGNTDVFLSIHTNSSDGTARGTTVWYCDTGEHVAYGPQSIDLCNKIGDAVISAIQAAGEKCADGATWGFLGGVGTRYGDLGEARIPQRPAAIIELGFHDNCAGDAPKLEEPFFQSVAMWGEYKGVCQFLGTTPTWDMYSDEFVSSDIPTTMAPGETRSAHITFRNRGVLWTSAKGFKLGAVDDSDPFTSTIRYPVSTDTGPGDTYTFTITLTAPTTPGYYTTDWRMIREGYQWFGATCSKTINVGGPPDTEPPTVPTNLSGSAVSPTQINLTWTASTDNVSVFGYKIYRGGSLIGTSATNSYSDLTCSPDTTYSYSVSAYDGSGNESAQCSPVNITTPFDAEIILDEEAATYTGGWSNATGPTPDCYNGDYKYATTASSETATATWTPTIPRAGNWEVYVYYRQGSNRTTEAPYTVYYNGGSQLFRVNQETGGGAWYYLATLPFAAGTAGYIKLGNNTSDTGQAVIADAVKFHYAGGGGSAPSITQHPSALTLCAGGSGSFSVTASGTGPLTYQWQKNQQDISNGGHYSGVTTATLTISNCDSSDAGNYRCVVTNSYGTATSNNAALTVVTTPAAPTAQAASSIGTDAITWNWSSVAGATGYKLWTASSGGTQIGGTISTNYYAENGLEPGTVYTRYVEAVNSCGASTSRTQLGPVATTARNCPENGGFESGFTSGVGNHWTKLSGTNGTWSDSTTYARTGSHSQKLTNSSGYADPIYQKLNVQPNRGYTVGYYSYRTVTNGYVTRIGINYTGGTTEDFGSDTGIGCAANTWVLKEVSFQSGATGVITILLKGGQNGGETSGYFDDVYLKPAKPTTSSGSTTIRGGQSATVTASGGFGGASSEMHWYTGPGGTGSHVGTGTSLIVSPAATVTLYPRWEASGCSGNCCVSDDGPAVTITVDSTPPTAVTVTDEGAYTPSQDTLKATWTASSDSGSGLDHYEYAIGASPGSQSVRNWTSTGLSTSVTATGLALAEGVKYYIQVRAVDRVGNVSAVSAADGITVAPGVAKISDAWPKNNSTDPISLRNKVVTATATGAFWLEEADRSAAIKVLSGAPASVGNTLSVAGALGMSGTQRVLVGDVVINQLGSTIIRPVAIGQQYVGGADFNAATPGVTGGKGLYNVGLLVRVFGRVDFASTADPNNKYFYLDDGSGLSYGGHNGIKVLCGSVDPPASGWAAATGVVVTESVGGKTVPEIMIRSANDVTPL